MSEPHERLDKAMSERRLDVRLQWSELASAANIKPESLRAIRRGDYRPSPLTARLLEDALRWERGSIAAILAGDEPEPVAERWTEAGQEAEPRSPGVPQTWQELRERMDEDPEYAQAVFDLIRTAQRIGGVLPAEEEDPRRHRGAG